MRDHPSPHTEDDPLENAAERADDQFRADPLALTTATSAASRESLEAWVLAEQEKVQHLALASGLEDILSLPLTIVQLKCLLIVLTDGSSTGTALGQRLRLSPPTISGVVERLVEAGYLRRDHSPLDRRVVVLHPTDKTSAWAHGVARSFQVRSAAVISELSDTELHHLARGTAAVRRVLERRPEAPTE